MVFAMATADIYLHNPRGSNNRLNERSANRKNANRVFDSQNNNRGGYNAGDATSEPANNDEGKQYRMKYFQSAAQGEGQTELTIEWTNQHGCGGNEDTDPHKLNCNIVIQYMCQPNVDSPTGTKDEDVFRNGVETSTPDYTKPQKNENANKARSRRRNNANIKRVLHEPWAWYDKCYVRERNKGLFTADQILKSNNLKYSSAIYTRQNPNGNRRGYECPEERDYYPYWHPTPWKDIVVLAENASVCGHYQGKSFNVQPYHECVEYWDAGRTRRKHYSRWNNAEECEANDGAWTAFYNYLEKADDYKSERACKSATHRKMRYIWALPYDSADGKTKECLVALQKPDCKEAPWSRSNHLGNGRDGVPNNYTWILPHFPSGETKRCVLRFRYNISTDDYDPYNTDHRHNKDKSKGIMSPIQQNPYVEVGAGASPLRLAINTAQFGRTFQDRSHVFLLMKRPPNTPNARIVNLNVRGKRGNIVQVYPAVEYDFIPNDLSMKWGDLVHIQWTGSNSHNNGNPAGDGQAGDAGEGKGGTDRSNIVEILNGDENFPLPFERTTLWKSAKIFWIYHGKINIGPKDLALDLSSSGYYRCMKKFEIGCSSNSFKDYIAESKTTMNNQLNNAPASFEGVLLRITKGVYYYMCTRNNNFTNRSQRGKITVK